MHRKCSERVTGSADAHLNDLRESDLRACDSVTQTCDGWSRHIRFELMQFIGTEDGNTIVGMVSNIVMCSSSAAKARTEPSNITSPPVHLILICDA